MLLFGKDFLNVQKKRDTIFEIEKIPFMGCRFLHS
jgi:hypothetical protein